MTYLIFYFFYFSEIIPKEMWTEHTIMLTIYQNASLKNYLAYHPCADLVTPQPLPSHQLKVEKKNPSQLANCHGCQATDTNSRKQTRGSHWRGWKRKALTRGRKKTGWWSLGWPPHMCGQQGGVWFFFTLSPQVEWLPAYSADYVVPGSSYR